jgi:type I restriction enzyme, R subunit
MAMITAERQLEEILVTKLRDLKYEYRPDIRDRATLEQNFREKFEALNRRPHPARAQQLHPR